MPRYSATGSRKGLRLLWCIPLIMVPGLIVLCVWAWRIHSRDIELLRQGNTLLDAGDPASLHKAIPLYQQAAAIFHDRPYEALNEGTCYYNLGLVYGKLHQNDSALQSYLQALDLYSTSKPLSSGDNDWDKHAKGHRADTLLNMGVLYDARHQSDQAVDAYRQAQQLYTEVGDTSDAVAAANNAGLTSLEEGVNNYKRKVWGAALTEFQQGQKFFRQANDRANEAICWQNMGLCYQYLHQADKAQDAFKQEKLLQPLLKTHS